MAQLYPSAYRLQFDDDASDPSNLVTGEEHSLVAGRYDIPIVMNEGVFYTKDFELRRENGTVMTLGTDYVFTAPEPFVTSQTGHQTATAVEIRETTYAGKLYATIRYVGGPEGKSNYLITKLIKAIENAIANPTINFNQIKGLPAAFKPAMHSHHPSDLTGLSEIAQAFREWANALVYLRPLGTSGMHLQEQIDALVRIVGLQRNSINDIGISIGSGQLLIDLTERLNRFEFIPDVQVTDIVAGQVRTIAEWDLNTVNGLLVSYAFTAATTKETEVGFASIACNGTKASASEYGVVQTSSLGPDDESVVVFSFIPTTNKLAITAICSLPGALKLKVIQAF